MFKLKKVLGNMLGKLMVFVAMNAVFISGWHSNCLILIGEPDVPEDLLKMKEEKYSIGNESSYL